VLLIRPRTVIAVLLFSLSSTMASALWSYSYNAAEGRKGPAETMLFIGLAACAFEILLAGAMLAESRRRRADLDSIAELVRSGGNLPYDRLARFGSFGERIRQIFQDISDVSERKSARIASLTGLLRAVLESVEIPMLVVGLDGRVVEASHGARTDERFEGLRVGHSRLVEFFPDADPGSVLQEADRSHAAVELKDGALLYPVFSVRGEISHFLADLSESRGGALSQRIKESLAPAAEKTASLRTSGKNAVRGLIGSLYKRLSGRD